ncbi:MAG: Crp/Fnr family transcriptional regulator [Clostridia bacterium]|nr:Crp/Fnr family transcriptional regulator [Clostridia bacterium]
MNDLFLLQTPLFHGLSAEDAKKLLHCLGAEKKSFDKDCIIYHAGDTVKRIGLVLSGSVNIESVDFLGNKSILSHAGPGQLFAETYAFLGDEPLMVSVAAAEQSKVLFLSIEQLLTTCPEACTCHTAMIKNLLTVSARKNISLSQKILHISPKSIRERLLAYLSTLSAQQGSRSVTIPFNRQQLADYLCVDRSALSNEISKMKKEGIIKAEKNKFFLQS